jgi:hypothetical protein
MIKTFKQLQEVDQLVASLYQKDKTLEQSKMGYAYKRFSEKNYFPVVKELQEKLIDIRVDNAMEDPTTKQILKDPTDQRGFKYSKEGLKKCIEQERKVIDEFNKREIEIIPYISSFVPEILTEDNLEELKGLIF